MGLDDISDTTAEAEPEEDPQNVEGNYMNVDLPPPPSHPKRPPIIVIPKAAPPMFRGCQPMLGAPNPSNFSFTPVGSGLSQSSSSSMVGMLSQ